MIMTTRKSLLIPFLAILIGVSASVMLAFNIFSVKYIEEEVTEQLLYTSGNSKILIKKELSEIVFEDDKEKIATVLQDVNRILSSTKTNLNIEVMLFGAEGEMLYPQSLEGSFLNDEIIISVRNELQDLSENQAVRMESDAATIAVSGYRLSELPISDIPFVVFASSLDIADGFISTVNRVLMICLAAGILMGAGVAVYSSAKIVGPLRELCDAVRKISVFEKHIFKKMPNIKELEELTRGVADMSEKIINYDESQRSFLQNASHEIRTPLMSIQGYAEGIEKGLFSQPEKAGEIISDESRKLSKLLSELLMLSRIDNMNYDREFEQADLNDLILDHKRSMEGIAMADNKKISWDITEEKLPVRYNETLFTQTLMNIASNAIRYAKKKIEISIFRDEKNAVIQIQDDGPGISDEDMSYIFERFYKGENGNTGLGLAIAKTAALASGWDIKAQNWDKGARFTITLPLAVT